MATSVKRKTYNKEEGTINDTLKDITQLLSSISEAENYYDILVDNRIELSFEKTKDEKDVYNLGPFKLGCGTTILGIGLTLVEALAVAVIEGNVTY